MKDDKKRILVVDDEEDICEIIQFNLEAEGFEIDTVSSSEQALKKSLHKYDLFLLDIMLKGMSGLKLAEELRKRKKIRAPIVFISARISENDRLIGFSAGADDYITKPFSIREMVARVHALLRRYSGEIKQEEKQEKLRLLGLELDLDKKRLYVDGAKTDVTPQEYKILKLLMKNAGNTYSRDQILSYAWKDINVIDRTVDVHITRLRKKLGRYGQNLISRSGYGYCFESETDEA